MIADALTSLMKFCMLQAYFYVKIYMTAPRLAGAGGFTVLSVVLLYGPLTHLGKSESNGLLTPTENAEHYLVFDRF
jgi:hypothetical protein